MSEKSYLRILQGGIILALFTVLFVFPSLLFPYISSKQLSFNILMEVLAAVWLVFILRFPSYRPKLNLIIYGLISYFAVILISAFTGVDFNLSFWGDIERMLGFFHIFHFLIFFFILITVFRTWKEWRVLLIASISAATLVSLIGLLGKHSYSTIGNTAYVSGYLIFNLFFTAILFIRSISKWRYLYLVPALIMLLQFKGMRTSGAIIGLAASLFLVMLLVGFLHEKKIVRRVLLSVSALAVIGVALIFSQQQASWFQNSFLRNLTSQKATFQTRLLSWQGAWREFGNHPILGTGFGNYAIIFDRQFNPKFFDYDKVETYFDRAHNNLIDIASTTGLAGLITYLSIFVFILIVLYKQLKVGGYHISASANGRRNLEVVIIFALLAAYFIQNLAVFDSLVTYIGLMVLIGFIIWRSKEGEVNQLEKRAPAIWLRGGRDGWLLAALLMAAWLFISAYSLKPWQMMTGVIDGYSQLVGGRPANGLEAFQNALSDTPLDRDGRATLINLAAANPVLFTALPADQIQEKYDYVVGLANKNLAYNPQDSLFLLQLAQLYDVGARIFNEDKEKSTEYSDLALEYADKAIAATPGRIPVYFSKAQSLLVQGKIEEAIAVTEYAANLNTNYPNSYCRLGQMYAITDREDDALGAFAKCVDGGAAGQLGTSNSILATAAFLAEKGDYTRAIIVLEKYLEGNQGEAETWLGLAQLYLLTDNLEKAQQAAGQAVLLDPEIKDRVELLFAK